MFLFKNTKSIVKRIGMNMAVYGFECSFVLMILAFCLPEIIANYVYILAVIFSFAAITGSIVSVLCFLVELFLFTKKDTKLPSVKRVNINEKSDNESENEDKFIPIQPSVTYEKKTVDDKTVFTIYKDELVYTYTRLERSAGVWGYDYMIKALINDVTHYLYFSEIPDRNEILGWNVMPIDKNVYDGIQKKEITNRFKCISFLGKAPFFSNDEYMPHIVVELMKFIYE